jgi:hypothetical protein
MKINLLFFMLDLLGSLLKDISFVEIVEFSQLFMTVTLGKCLS